MAYFAQKETRYVIERAGSNEYSVFRVVDTVDEVMQVIGNLDDDFENEWNDFISEESNEYKDEDRWKVTRCKKAV